MRVIARGCTICGNFVMRGSGVRLSPPAPSKIKDLQIRSSPRAVTYTTTSSGCSSQTGSHIPNVDTGCSGCGGSTGEVDAGSSNLFAGGSAMGSNSSSNDSSNNTSNNDSSNNTTSSNESCSICVSLGAITVWAPGNSIQINLLQSTSGPSFTLTPDEMYLVRIIFAEGGAKLTNQVVVGSIVNNRYNLLFDGALDYEDVVMDPNQFAVMGISNNCTKMQRIHGCDV